MFDVDNLYFSNNIPQSVRDKYYDELVEMLNDTEGVEDKIVYVTMSSSFSTFGQLFFKIYTLNSYSEKDDLENKPNFLYFLDHA